MQLGGIGFTPNIYHLLYLKSECITKSNITKNFNYFVLRNTTNVIDLYILAN